MWNILLADDHSIVRAGIKALIKEKFGMYKVDEATNENEVVEAVKNTNYDLVVLDINMGDSDFGKLMEWMRTIAPDTNILVFTAHPEEIYGPRSLSLGAKGYLRKTATDAEIVSAIRTVLGGKKYINSILADILSQNLGNKQITNPFQNLSSREMEIALLLNTGKSLSEICTILNIQYSTANTYKRRIFEKLNVNSVVALCRLLQSFNIQE
jgi:two-component system invasion response regulator UvrY